MISNTTLNLDQKLVIEHLMSSYQNETSKYYEVSLIKFYACVV